MGRPRKKRTTQVQPATNFRWGRSFSDQLSTIPVIRDSTLQNSVSIPRTYQHKNSFRNSVPSTDTRPKNRVPKAYWRRWWPRRRRWEDSAPALGRWERPSPAQTLPPPGQCCPGGRPCSPEWQRPRPRPSGRYTYWQHKWSEHPCMHACMHDAE